MGLLLKTEEGKSFILPVGHSENELDSWADREIVLGLRPEHISDSFPHQEEDQQIHAIECRVKVIEPTGPDTLVFVGINEEEVTCRVRPDEAVSPGGNMELMIDMSKAVFFEPESGKRIA
jgi:multiple sugar transport system ATP-binding protein